MLDRRRTWKWVGALVLLVLLVAPAASSAARLKDIAAIGGVRENQLFGYGLVVGLMGTGDDVKNGFTRDTIANLLSRQGLAMRDKSSTLKAKNVAAVMVTANLPRFAKVGSRMDVTVSSMGDATSLQGGTLLMTPLKGADGEVYGVAQGAVAIGGFSASGAGASAVKNQTNVGIITNGASVEKEVRFDFAHSKMMTVNLYQPDFTTVSRVAAALNKAVGGIDARLKDASTVVISVPASFSGNVVALATAIENIEVNVDMPAVVVLNEKTGTVVMGENVRISTVAVAHGNLSIQIKETPVISQPLPFAPQPGQGTRPIVNPRDGTIVAPGGQTVVAKDTTIGVTEEKNQLMLLPKAVTIQEMVQALNAIGVTPRDLITILQAIKAAGALQAELKLI
jgi:flagellar P-ring protein precursor FlgI